MENAKWKEENEKESYESYERNTYGVLDALVAQVHTCILRPTISSHWVSFTLQPHPTFPKTNYTLDSIKSTYMKVQIEEKEEN